MKNSKQFYAIFIIMLLSSFVITSISFAQTHIPEGDVSGTWIIDGSPYIIDGFVTVPVDSTLIIEPGVFIIFSTNQGLQIEGRLLSEGTENDSIIFTVQDSSNNTGLSFYHTDITNQDSSKITYSIFEHVSVCFDKSSNILFRKSSVSKCVGWSGVFFDENSSPSLIDITITNNTTDYYGGGIYCTDSSNPSLVNVTISGNSAGGAGGVYCSYNSNPIFENVIIADNYPQGICCNYSSSPILNNVTISGHEGGGIACSDNSNPTLNNVIISNNSIYGGLFSSYSNPILNDVIIKENTSNEFGGGIYCFGESNLILKDAVIKDNNSLDGGGIFCDFGAEMSLVNVVITGNTAVYSGGAITCFNQCNMSLTNVTISRDTVSVGGGGVIYCDFESNMNFRNSILWNNIPNEISISCGSVVTFAFSDIQGGWQGVGNIDTDPLFADPANGDFHLTWANFPIQDSTMSPCIDAGDPNSPLDPDSTRADMGAYYFDQTQNSVINIPIPKSEFMLYQNYPNPFITVTKISYNLPVNIKNTTIEIFNIKGQKIKQYSIFNSQSSIIWDGKDENGKQLSNGIYLYKLSAGRKSITKKMLLMR